MKNYASSGATTDHGGTVEGTICTSTFMGKSILRVGDTFFCPTCKRVSTFRGPGCDPNFTVMDKHVLMDGAVADCGARLIANQPTIGRGDMSSGRGSSSDLSSLSLAANSSSKKGKSYSLRFKVTDAEGNPYKEHPYIAIDTSSDNEFRGFTDSEGFTNFIDTTDKSCKVLIHVMDKMEV